MNVQVSVQLYRGKGEMELALTGSLGEQQSFVRIFVRSLRFSKFKF